MAQKNIRSVLHEERLFPPPPHFAEHASPNAAELERLYAGLRRSERSMKHKGAAKNRRLAWLY